MPPASGEYSNRAVARAGGVTVIVLDRLNTSFEDQKLARDQIIEFLKDVRPEDRIALYVLQSGSVEILHDFTRDNASLIAALARYLRAGLLPSARRWEGAYHAIRVMLTRGGASVRSRKRYYATPLEAPDAATSQKALLDAMRSPLEALDGFSFDRVIALRPDSHRLHIIVRDVPSGTIGSVIVPTDALR